MKRETLEEERTEKKNEGIKKEKVKIKSKGEKGKKKKGASKGNFQSPKSKGGCIENFNQQTNNLIDRPQEIQNEIKSE